MRYDGGGGGDDRRDVGSEEFVVLMIAVPRLPQRLQVQNVGGRLRPWPGSQPGARVGLTDGVLLYAVRRHVPQRVAAYSWGRQGRRRSCAALVVL
jgi:hypothetical protein